MIGSYSDFNKKFPYIKFSDLKEVFERISSGELLLNGDHLIAKSSQEPALVRSSFRIALNYLSEGEIDGNWFKENEWSNWELIEARKGDDGRYSVKLPKLCA